VVINKIDLPEVQDKKKEIKKSLKKPVSMFILFLP